MSHARTMAILVGGGSHIGISRANPTEDPAARLQQEADGRIRVVHVPKTIDNDLDLPAGAAA